MNTQAYQEVVYLVLSLEFLRCGTFFAPNFRLQINFPIKKR